jgi:hypothetical protein
LLNYSFITGEITINLERINVNIKLLDGYHNNLGALFKINNADEIGLINPHSIYFFLNDLLDYFSNYFKVL